MSGAIENNSSRSSGSVTTKGSGITLSTGDPTVSTNPASLGTMFVNTTSGEAYVCTDITAGSNVWTNMGDGTGDIEPWYMITSTTSFFVLMGYNSVATANIARIDRFALASDGNATDWGDTFSPARVPGTSQSATHGYAHGGYHDSNGDTNVIQKFAKSSASDATDVANLTFAGRYLNGMSGVGYGYLGGGYPPAAGITTIQKYAHTSDADATNIGTLANTDYGKRGNQSETYGYMFGGVRSSSHMDDIDKIAFSNDSYSANVASLVSGVTMSSTATADGYVLLAGAYSASHDHKIDKFATASDNDSVATGGTLNVPKTGDACGGSSTTHGYIAGGYASGEVSHNGVEKYSLNISSGTSTDVGDLHTGLSHFAGQGCQY